MRLNPAIFASLPASACALGTTGPNGDDYITRNTYDAADQLTKVTNGYGTVWQTDVQTLSYTANGKLATVKDAMTNLTTYEYDGFDRLAKLRYPSPTRGSNASGATDYEAYGYDASGGIVSRALSNDLYLSHPGAATKSYVANGLDQYLTVAGTGVTHDARGNLTSDRSRTFTYDIENRLLTASGPTAVSLGYDPLGRLQTTTASGATTTYLYDRQNLVGEYNAAGTFLRRYVPGPGADEPALWYEGAGTTGRRWPIADEAGSIIGYTGPTGGSAGTYGYGPFGEPDVWTGLRYRYTGQIMIPEAQLYYYKARVYDPGLGRFLQTDPVGQAGGVNIYAYVGNDPLNFADPTGLAEPDKAPTQCQNGCYNPDTDTVTADDITVTAKRRDSPEIVIIENMNSPDAGSFVSASGGPANAGNEPNSDRDAVQMYKCQEANAAADAHPLIETPDWRANDISALQFDKQQLESEISQERFVLGISTGFSASRAGVAIGRMAGIGAFSNLAKTAVFGPEGTVVGFALGAVASADLARNTQRLAGVNARLRQLKECK